MNLMFITDDSNATLEYVLQYYKEYSIKPKESEDGMFYL